MALDVGDLVQMKREPSAYLGEGIPIGIIIETESTTGEWFYCRILWDDGDVTGAWVDELRNLCKGEVKCK